MKPVTIGVIKSIVPLAGMTEVRANMRGIWAFTRERKEVIVCITVTIPLRGKKLRIYNHSSIDHLTAAIDIMPQQIYIQRITIPAGEEGQVSYLLVSCPEQDKESIVLTEVDNLDEQIKNITKQTLYLPGNSVTRLKSTGSFDAMVTGTHTVVSEIAKKVVAEILGMIHSL